MKLGYCMCQLLSVHGLLGNAGEGVMSDAGWLVERGEWRGDLLRHAVERQARFAWLSCKSGMINV